MRRKNRAMVTWVIVALLFCSTLSLGCEPSNWFRSNFSVNVVLPMGLAGTPGLLNPFGIVQAFVNALLGVGTTDEDTEAYTTPSASASPPQVPDQVIGVIVS